MELGTAQMPSTPRAAASVPQAHSDRGTRSPVALCIRYPLSSVIYVVATRSEVAGKASITLVGCTSTLPVERTLPVFRSCFRRMIAENVGLRSAAAFDQLISIRPLTSRSCHKARG